MMSIIPKSVQEMSHDTSWSRGDLQNYLSAHYNLSVPRHFPPQHGTWNSTILNHTPNTQQHGIQPKHAQSSHLHPNLPQWNRTLTPSLWARSPKDTPHPQTPMSQLLVGQSHKNISPGISNTSWSVWVCTHQHVSSTLDTTPLDHKSTINFTRNSGADPTKPPLDNPPSRLQDQHLMNDFLIASYTSKELQIINNCRMFLQVTTLAKIMNHNRTHLLPNILYHNNQIPSLIFQIQMAHLTQPSQNCLETMV